MQYFFGFLVFGAFFIFILMHEHENAQASKITLPEILSEGDSLITPLVDEAYDLLDQEKTRGRTAGFARELKLLKKQLALHKRLLNQRMKERRAEYTRVRRFTPPRTVGEGGIGVFLRALESRDHHIQRASLAQTLLPDELERDRVEAAILEIDHVLLRLIGRT